MLQGYPAGGAGYVLSKEALRRFGQKQKGLCREDEGCEDVAMGECMQALGVTLGDSRDALGRHRFHCYSPSTHIHGSYPEQFADYEKYDVSKVRDLMVRHLLCSAAFVQRAT
jgi:glycoprotein-N-acetylgalactosamine 3-beta-galactosyltransferase